MLRLIVLLAVFEGQFGPSHAADDDPANRNASRRFEKLAPFFEPPAEWANDFGSYKSPLLFYDGSRVQTAADWPRRRQEILEKWHALMGPWPEILESPQLEILKEERRGTLTEQHVRIEVAPGKRTDDAYLLVPDGKGPFPGR